MWPHTIEFRSFGVLKKVIDQTDVVLFMSFIDFRELYNE